MAADKTGEDGLAALLYSSRATAEFDAHQLDDLVSRARRRNRAEGITGTVLYEEGRFLQWLEGPPAALGRLYTAIGRDRRHTDVELISHGPTGARLFGDWSLRLIRAGAEPVPAQVLDWPEARHAALSLADGRTAGALAALALAPGGLPGAIRACEDIMAAYGELWAEEACQDVDITIGLAALLSAFRRWRHGAAQLDITTRRPPLLVVPCPGEPHILGAALAAEMLIESGRPVIYAFPDCDEALGELVAKADVAGLALVSSGVFSRSHWQGRIEASARAARDASGGNGLRVAHYGRLPEYGCSCACGEVDYTCNSALALADFFEPAPAVLH